MTPGGGALYLFLLPLLATCVLAAVSYRYSLLTADDSFITFRYARNLVQGHGPVWNVGERVEGYTNFLWMIILALLMGMGAEPVVTSKVLGVVFLALTIFEVPRLLRHYPWTFPRSVPLVMGMMVVGPWLPYWAVQGMETPLFGYLVILSVRTFLDDAGKPPKPSMAFRAPLALTFLALSRPDGIVVGGVIFLCFILTTAPGQRLRSVVFFALPFLLIYAPYFVWRYSYYGFFLPNTFYVKTGARWDLVVRGLRYVLDFLVAVGPALLLFVVKPAYGGALRRADRVILAVSGSFAAYVALVGGDYMPFHRFLTPLLPLLWVLVGDGLVAGYNWARSLARVPSLVALAAYLLLLAGPALASLREIGKEDVYSGLAGAMEPDSRFGAFLGRTAPPGASIATTIIGKMGYYSDLPVRDLLGLTEPAIAHKALKRVGPMAGHDKMDLGYALSKRPTFFYFRPVMRAESPRGVPRVAPSVTPLDRRKVFLDPAFKPFAMEFNRDYRAVHVDFGDLALDLYVRRDAAWPPCPDYS